MPGNGTSHGEIIRAWDPWDGSWPSVDMVDEAPNCNFCEMNAIWPSVNSSSNRQELFPFLLVIVGPIFLGDIYIYIFKSLECEDSDEYDAHADDAVAVAPSG